MKQTLLSLFLLIALFSNSQEAHFNSKSYDVTLNDLKLNTYTKDTIANALVIYEYGNSYIDNDDYELKTEIKRKVKILNREGFNEANIQIPLFKNKNGSEKVSKIKATTYNLVDGVIKATILIKKNIFEENYDENHNLYKFTLPNIKEGSVITYSYILSSPFVFKYKGWNFQEDIPVLYSEYRTLIPGIYDYNIKLVGGKKLSINEQKLKKECLKTYNGGVADCAYSIYAMENVPAFIEEDYMTSKSNYLSRIEYELKTYHSFTGGIENYTKTWETVARELRTDKNIGKQLSKTVDIESLMGSEILNERDSLEKAKKIYKYVQDNYTWNGYHRIFKDVSVKKLIEEKSGNISAINILLHNLLNEANITVKPLLLSTRDQGFTTKIFPVLSEFNYLLVQATINDKTYLLDATDDYLSFGMIPFKCLNGYGRLLDLKKGSEWVDITPPKYTAYYVDTQLKIDDDIVSGTVKSQSTGYYALKQKKKYFPNSNAYIEDLDNSSPFVEISDFKVLSDDKSDLFKSEYHVEYNNDNTGNMLYIAPVLVKLFNENPFKLQERTYPVDFGYKMTYFYVLTFQVGDNYSIEDIPKNTIVALPNNTGKASFSAKADGNTIQVNLNITFRHRIYPAEYYPYLKALMGKIIDIQNNALIVLKKK